MAVVDWDDPCARAIAFRDAYYELVAGRLAVSIETRHGDTSQSKTYATGDAAALKALWAEAAAECAAGATVAKIRTLRLHDRSGW